MKITILSGLTAIALGALTSCSNILEDNGINPGAKAETGLLSLNLNTDASVGVMTKAEGDITINTDNVVLDVKGNYTKSDKTTVNNHSLGTSADYKNGAEKVVPAGTYTKICAESSSSDQMSGDLDWDKPMFYGELTNLSLDVTTTGPAAKPNGNLTATLTNSIITIDEAKFTEFRKDVTIESLVVYTDDENNGKKLWENSNLVTGKYLYVKAGVAAKIKMTGTLKNESSVKVEAVTNIVAGDKTQTEAAKNYKINYSLNKENGKLKLEISINGTVTEVPITVNVNPYQDTNTNN